MNIDPTPGSAARPPGHGPADPAHRVAPEPRDTPGRVVDAARRRLARHGPLPLPGRGATLARWRILAEVGGEDLSVAKVFESHADAVAILAELDADQAVSADALWAVWAAEAPDAVLRVDAGGAEQDAPPHAAPGTVRLDGSKAWCSAATGVTHALVTARRADGSRQLCAVALRAPGVATEVGDWAAVGMAGTASATVRFEAVRARAVGAPDAYLSRPGFWHGGAGVAACWYGAARALGLALHAAVRAAHAGTAGDVRRGADGAAAAPRDERAVLRSLALGRIDLALGQAAALLREVAARIDAAPDDPQVDA
ncbi:MAG: hypothetical protein EHM87_00385, partial [Burkholderiales bacterium]